MEGVWFGGALNAREDRGSACLEASVPRMFRVDLFEFARLSYVGVNARSVGCRWVDPR